MNFLKIMGVSLFGVATWGLPQIISSTEAPDPKILQEIKSQIQEWLGEKDRKSFWLFGHAVTIQKIQNSEISWVVRFAQSHTSFEVNGKDDKVTHNWTRNWREAASVSDLKFLLQSLRIGLGKEPTPSGRVTSELEGWLRQIKTRRNHDIRSKVLIK